MVDEKKNLRWLTTGLLGLLILFGFAALLWCVSWAWPEAVTDGGDGKRATVTGWKNRWGHSGELVILVLVVVMSALGSYVHLATSFASFVGNKRLEKSWVWWYLLRLNIGVALAVVFYAVVRGGFFAGNAPVEVVSPFGFAAIAGLVGMFSKQATDKLRELFDTLFKVAEGKGDDEREGKLAKLLLTKLEPDKVAADAEATITIGGEGFTDQCVVLVDGAEFKPEFISADKLRVKLPADTLQAGTLKIVVRRGVDKSNALDLAVG